MQPLDARLDPSLVQPAGGGLLDRRNLPHEVSTRWAGGEMVLATGGDEREAVGIHATDTITKMLPAHRGHVVVAGSHGGVYAGWCAAKGGARAVILNDAGIGKDRAGTASLAFLDRIGLAAATADSQSCRIADAADMLAAGVISAVNDTAAALGCAPGQTVRDCAARMQSAALPSGPVPPLQEARFTISQDGGRVVIGIDSASLFLPEDAGRIVVTASHGALVGGRPDGVVPPGMFAAFFHDAGGAKDGSGYTRLAALDGPGVIAATVAADSARIGDARSCYQDGVVSHVNEAARGRGGQVGMTLRAFIDTLRQA